MAFFRVVVIWDWPTTVEKSCGLYFRALTMNLSILANLPQIPKSRCILYKMLSMNRLYRSNPLEEGNTVTVANWDTGRSDLDPAFFYRIYFIERDNIGFVYADELRGRQSFLFWECDDIRHGRCDWISIVSAFAFPRLSGAVRAHVADNRFDIETSRVKGLTL
jgi:hypothetical protein